MKDDDPEQRIRELERGFSGPTPGWGGSRNRPHFTPPRRSVPLGWRLFAVGAVLASIIVALAAVLHLLIGFAGKTSGGNAGPAGTAGGVPITLEHGGALTAGGNGTTDTYACNDGDLTLTANNSTVTVTGHCVSLKLGGFDNHVKVDNADTVEVSGFNDTLTQTACNDGKLTVSGYGNVFTVGGHCGSLAISNYGNRVQLDSIDTISVVNYGNRISVAGHCGSVKVAAYDNQVQIDTADTIDVSGFGNTVTYHSGSPKITKSGNGITVKQG